MTANSQNEKIFEEFESNSPDILIVRHGYKDWISLSEHFRDAANRLADTITGRGCDDAILIPFLYLYRHAVELQLKSTAQTLEKCSQLIQQQKLENHDSEYLRTEKKLDSELKKAGHSICKLFNMVDRRFNELLVDIRNQLGDTESLVFELSEEDRKMIHLLHDVDPSGINFRYPTKWSDEVYRMDFLEIRRSLERMYKSLGTYGCLMDILEEYAP